MVVAIVIVAADVGSWWPARMLVAVVARLGVWLEVVVACRREREREIVNK